MRILVLREISKYIISLCLCLIFVAAKAEKKIIAEKQTAQIPWYTGSLWYTDLGSVVQTLTSKSDFYTYEAGVQLGLKNKIFPTFEVGYAGADKTSVANIGYTTHAPFYRLGADINLLKNKPEGPLNENLFLAGFRVGASSFKYTVSNVNITDDYWGETQALQVGSQSTQKYWYELVAGVRVQLFQNVYVGWTGRRKYLITQNKDGVINPWYIPGFGINTGSRWGFTYTIGYKF